MTSWAHSSDSVWTWLTLPCHEELAELQELAVVIALVFCRNFFLEGQKEWWLIPRNDCGTPRKVGMCTSAVSALCSSLHPKLGFTTQGCYALQVIPAVEQPPHHHSLCHPPAPTAEAVVQRACLQHFLLSCSWCDGVQCMPVVLLPNLFLDATDLLRPPTPNWPVVPTDLMRLPTPCAFWPVVFTDMLCLLTWPVVPSDLLCLLTWCVFTDLYWPDVCLLTWCVNWPVLTWCVTTVLCVYWPVVSTDLMCVCWPDVCLLTCCIFWPDVCLLTCCIYWLVVSTDLMYLLTCCVSTDLLCVYWPVVSTDLMCVYWPAATLKTFPVQSAPSSIAFHLHPLLPSPRPTRQQTCPAATLHHLSQDHNTHFSHLMLCHFLCLLCYFLCLLCYFLSLLPLLLPPVFTLLLPLFLLPVFTLLLPLLLCSSLYLATTCLYFATSCLYFATSSLYFTTSCLYFAASCLYLATSSLYFATSYFYLATSSLYFATSCLYLATSSLNFATSCLHFATSSLYVAAFRLYFATSSTFCHFYPCVTHTQNYLQKIQNTSISQMFNLVKDVHVFWLNHSLSSHTKRLKTRLFHQTKQHSQFQQKQPASIFFYHFTVLVCYLYQTFAHFSV